jgi:hypothetical protein
LTRKPVNESKPSLTRQFRGVNIQSGATRHKVLGDAALNLFQVR